MYVDASSCLKQLTWKNKKKRSTVTSYVNIHVIRAWSMVFNVNPTVAVEYLVSGGRVLHRSHYQYIVVKTSAAAAANIA